MRDVIEVLVSVGPEAVVVVAVVVLFLLRGAWAALSAIRASFACNHFEQVTLSIPPHILEEYRTLPGVKSPSSYENVCLKCGHIDSHARRELEKYRKAKSWQLRADPSGPTEQDGQLSIAASKVRDEKDS